MTATNHFELTLSSSDIIAIVSTLVTVLSIAFGVYQSREARKARQETSVARELLLSQQVSQHFSAAANKALILYRSLRESDWEKAAEAGMLLCADLANAVGFPDHLAGSRNREKIDAAVYVMGNLMHTIPAPGEDPSPEIRRELMHNCQIVLVSVNAVEGSMRLRTALGGDPNEHITHEPINPAKANDTAQPGRGISDEAR